MVKGKGRAVVSIKKNKGGHKHSLANGGAAEAPADEEQGKLDLEETENVERPDSTEIQNDRMACIYQGMKLTRDKESTKYITLEFSINITKSHHKYIPKKTVEAHNWLIKSSNSRADVENIKPQTIELFETQDIDKPAERMVGAVVTRADVQEVETKGTGHKSDVYRFRFFVTAERARDLLMFAGWREGERFWLVMEGTQREMAGTEEEASE